MSFKSVELSIDCSRFVGACLPGGHTDIETARPGKSTEIASVGMSLSAIVIFMPSI